MDDLVLTCDHCGHEMVVSAHALGAKGRCAGCGAILEVGSGNTRPFDEASLSGVTGAVTVRAAEAPPTRCARCGREFRGDWDRNEGPEGTICLICKRLVREDQPVAPEAPIGELAPESSLLLDQGEPATRPKYRKPAVPRFAKDYPQLFRGTVLALGLLVVALAVYFTFSDTGPLPDRSEGEYLTAQARLKESGLAGAVWWVLLSMTVVFGVAGHGTLLAVILYYAGRLPADGFVQNLVLLAPSAVVISILGCMPFVGTFLVIWYLFDRYDFGCLLLAAYLLLHPLTTLLAFAVSQFVYGLLGLALL